MISSWSRLSPACGTEAKKPALASKPELKRSATGERKVRARRASSAAWAVQYIRRREPPELRIDGTVLSAARMRPWRLGEVVRERSLEQAAKVWSEPLTVLKNFVDAHVRVPCQKFAAALASCEDTTVPRPHHHPQSHAPTPACSASRLLLRLPETCLSWGRRRCTVGGLYN